MRHKDRKIHLPIAEMLAEMRALATESETIDPAFALILAAGERRDYNANQIVRDPQWRKVDLEGELRIHPTDAVETGVQDGGYALCQWHSGEIEVKISFDNAQRRGFVSLHTAMGSNTPTCKAKKWYNMAGAST